MNLHIFVNELNDELQGCVAMDSVILERLNNIAKKFKQPAFGTYVDAVLLVQKHGFDCDECPECGWISEGNWYEHPDHDGVCSDCEVVKE